MNNEEKILKCLFEEPHREFHIRLLARLTGLNPNTILTITEKLAKEGILIKEKHKDRNIVAIKPNSHDIFHVLRKKFYNLNKIYKSGLVEFLNDKLSYPTMVLFGSYAKGENHERSDIDIFVISEAKKKIDISKYEKKLGAEIQLFMHTKKEFNALKKNSPELINNVLNGHTLTGYLAVL